MRVRELYNILFTEYTGYIGYAPAIMTLAICIAVGVSVLYGGALLGKSFLADRPAIETGHS